MRRLLILTAFFVGASHENRAFAFTKISNPAALHCALAYSRDRPSFQSKSSTHGRAQVGSSSW